MRTFKNKRNYRVFAEILLYLSPAILLILAVSYYQDKPMIEAFYASLYMTILTQGLIAIFFFTTRYKLDEKYFYYRSGFIFGKIEVSSIHKLDLNKTLFVGMRPATSRNGIIIYYNKYDEIYISPENNVEFAEALLELNPEIKIIRHKKTSN